MISISIRWSLMGWHVDWTMKTSAPRTVSKRDTEISPSENFDTSVLESLIPRLLQILFANGTLEFPQIILISLPCAIVKTSGFIN
jgi:hypothetical protein